MTAALPAGAAGHDRFAYYQSGYHMLLRDLDGERVRGDIAAWVETGSLPPERVTK